MRGWWTKADWKHLGRVFLYLGIGLVVVLGLGYLDRDDVPKPRWLATITHYANAGLSELADQTTWYVRPDCAADEVQATVLELTRDLVMERLPRDVPLPFVMDAFEPGSILDYGTDDANIQHCWTEIFSPYSYDQTKRYRVGEVTYIVAEDAADPAQYVVRVTLEALNLDWLPEQSRTRLCGRSFWLRPIAWSGSRIAAGGHLYAQAETGTGARAGRGRSRGSHSGNDQDRLSGRSRHRFQFDAGGAGDK